MLILPNIVIKVFIILLYQLINHATEISAQLVEPSSPSSSSSSSSSSLSSTSTTNNVLNFGGFIAYFCDNEQLMATSSTCDVTISRQQSSLSSFPTTKPILFRTHQHPKLFKCNSCHIGDITAIGALHFSLEVTTVDLSNSHVTHIEPLGISGTFKILILANNDIEQLDDVKIFQKTSKLTALDLSYNRLNLINGRAFDGLPNLKTLWLCNNNISHLFVRTFANLPDLEVLKLHSNQLNQLSGSLFLQNSRLIELTINENRLSVVDELGWQQLERIEVIDLDNIRQQLLTYGQNEHKITNEEHCEMKIGDLMYRHQNNIVDHNQFVNLSCQQIVDHLPFDQLDQINEIKFLNLRYNEIERLLDQPFIFAKASELIAIDLSHNQISDINSDAFNGLLRLEVLLLPYNMITYLDRRTFENLLNLQQLRLDHNRLQRIDTHLFFHNINLMELYLNDNEINQLGDHVFDQLQQLQQLSMFNNLIGNDVVVTMNSNWININKSGVSYLNIGNRVQRLDAIDNRLSSTDISQASELIIMKLGKNNLVTMDLTVQKQLKSIDLSENRLTQISFINNHELIEINLSGNFLVDIQLRSLVLLESLDVSHNFLQSINLDRSYNLLRLNVSSNLLKTLQDLTGLMYNLRILDVSSNPLEQLERSIFQNMENLDTLYLRNCGLKQIATNLFEHQFRLERLDIGFNELDDLDMMMFAHLSNLWDLKINGNNLTDINAGELMRYSRRLDQIDLAQNAWTCRRLKVLVEYFAMNYVTVLTESDIDSSTGGSNESMQYKRVKGISCLPLETDDFNLTDINNNFGYLSEIWDTNNALQLSHFHCIVFVICFILKFITNAWLFKFNT